MANASEEIRKLKKTALAKPNASNPLTKAMAVQAVDRRRRWGPGIFLPSY